MTFDRCNPWIQYQMYQMFYSFFWYTYPAYGVTKYSSFMFLLFITCLSREGFYNRCKFVFFQQDLVIDIHVLYIITHTLNPHKLKHFGPISHPVVKSVVKCVVITRLNKWFGFELYYGSLN